MNEIAFFRKKNGIEYIFYKDWNMSYPLHTHTKHIVVGIVENGMVCVIEDDESSVYGKNESFSILPNVPHEIKPADDKPFSMLLMCIEAEYRHYDEFLDMLGSKIAGNPEERLLINDMAAQVNMSPFHTIRTFKKAFGLTPHQFQIQCRVRKAQRMLEKGKSVTEAAFDTGFCDESHFDRCFRKIMQISPTEYKKSVIYSD